MFALPPRRFFKPMHCKTKFCRGRTTEGGHSPYCGKCRNRHWKERHPLKYSFHKLRNRAKERGHTFTITFADYERFALETGYAELKGRTKHCLSIHRKEDHIGYEPGNIQAVTVSLNSRLKWANIPDYIKAEMIEAEQRALAATN